MSLKTQLEGGVLTARSLRSVKAGMDDEAIKRWALSTLGWKFCRRKGAWIKGTRQLDPEHTLEYMLAAVIRLDKIE